MGNFKGTGIVFLRELFAKQGAQAEEQFLSQLNEEEVRLYQRAMPVEWVPIQAATKMLTVASHIVYPDDPNGMQRIGRDVALDHLKGMYRILLKVATIPFAIKQAARMWRTYNDTGDGKAWSEGERKASFVVENYPGMPVLFGELLRGYIAGIVELTGGLGVKVSFDSSNPDAWKWSIDWQ